MKTKLRPYHLLALVSLVRRHKLKMSLIIGVFVVAIAANALIPYYTGKLVGLLAGQKEVTVTAIAAALGYIMAGNVAHGVFWALGDYLNVRWSNPMRYKFRKIAVSTVLQRYEYKDYIDKPTSKVASSAIDADDGASRMIENLYYRYMPSFVEIPSLIVVAAFVNVYNLLLYILLTGVLIIVSRHVLQELTVSSAKHADNRSSKNGQYFDIIGNFVNIKAFRAESYEIKRVEKSNESLGETSMTMNYAVIKFWRVASIIIRLFVWGSVLALNLYLYAQKKIDVTGLAIAVTVLVAYTNKIWELVDVIGSFSSDAGAYKQNYMYAFGDTNIVEDYYRKTYRTANVEKPLFETKLSLSGLSFAYPDRPDTLVLKNVELEIYKNERIGVVGRSGSGKSTLVKLLLGFYDFEPGSIMVDGMAVSKQQLATLNSYVPQDTSLFQESIAYNICYGVGDENISKDKVVEAAKKAHADEFVLGLKDGYDTMIGERGVKLSLGQRQRIALARSFYSQNNILILDEATSALDSKTEKLVQDSLEKLWDNHTVIAIAHRLSTLNNVDRIVVMDAGQIVEVGTKEELLSAKKHFYELWKHQRDGLLLEE